MSILTNENNSKEDRNIIKSEFEGLAEKTNYNKNPKLKKDIKIFIADDEEITNIDFDSIPKAATAIWRLRGQKMTVFGWIEKEECYKHIAYYTENTNGDNMKCMSNIEKELVENFEQWEKR